jgi:hypothetical protein
MIFKNIACVFCLMIFISVKSTVGLTIECTFRMESWPEINSVYTCYTKTVTNVGVNSITSLTGTHLSGKKNVNVEAVHFDANSMSSFPANLNSYFPNLKLIKMSGLRLTTVSANDFKNFPNLIVFALRTTPIDSIPSNLFANNRNLRYVAIASMDSLRHIGRNVINLSNLKTANFQNNACVNQLASNRNDVITLNSNLHIFCAPKITYCPSKCNDETTKLDKRVKTVENGINNHIQLINEQKTTISNLNKTVNSLQTSFLDLRQISNDQKSSISTMNKTLNSQGNTILDLKKLTDELKFANEKQNQTINSIESSMKDFKKFSSDQDKINQDLKASLTNQTKTIEEQNGNISNLQDIIADLKVKIIELENRILEITVKP